MKNTIRKITMAIAGAIMAIGLTLSASVPAHAITKSFNAYCNWPTKAKINVWNHSGNGSMRLLSPSGYYLMTYYFNGNTSYTTRWEDVRVTVYSNDSSYSVNHNCVW